MVQTAETIWRDFVTDGVPASGKHDPRKVDIREWGKFVETGVLGGSAGAVVFASKSAMDAALAYAANTMAWVIGDAIVANNGIYQKTGASGAGAWVRRGDLPYSFIRSANTGTGTANAIVAVSSVPMPAVDGAALITVNITAENTGPATVSFNGAAPLNIVTSSGNPLAAGYLKPGMLLAGFKEDTNFRLLTEVASAAILAVAEAYAEQAVTAAQAAVDAMSSVVVTEFPTLAAAQAYSPEVAPSFMRTAGRVNPGDGGGALHKYVPAEPSHGGKFFITLSDGVTVVWYEIAEEFVRPEMFGAPNDGVGDATAAVQAALSSGFNIKMRKNSNYLIKAGLVALTAGQMILFNGATLSSANVAEKQLIDIQADDVELHGPGTINGSGLPPIVEDFIGVTWNGIGILSRGTSGAKRTGLYIGGRLKIRNCPGSALALEHVSDGEIDGVRAYNCDTNTTYDGPGVYLINYMTEFTVSDVAGRDFNWKGWNQSNSSNFTFSNVRFKNGKDDQCAVFHKGCSNFVTSTVQIVNAFGVKCDKSNDFVLTGLNVDCANYGFGGLMVQAGARFVCDSIKVKDYTAYGIIHAGHPSAPATGVEKCVYSNFSITLTGTPPTNRGALHVSSYTTATAQDVIFSNGYISNCFYGGLIDSTTNLATDNVIFDNIVIDGFTNAGCLGASRNTTWRNLKFRNGAASTSCIRLLTGASVNAEKYVIEGCEGDNLDASINFVNATTTGTTGIRVNMLVMSRNKMTSGGRLINLSLNNASDFIRMMEASGNSSYGASSASSIQLSNNAPASPIQLSMIGNILINSSGAKQSINFVENAASGKFNGVVANNMATVTNPPGNV